MAGSITRPLEVGAFFVQSTCFSLYFAYIVALTISRIPSRVSHPVQGLTNDDDEVERKRLGHMEGGGCVIPLDHHVL